MLDAPVFNDPLSSEIAGDDPLGLAPTNERLYGDVFPGINNVVRYIRVYSALCWMALQVERYYESEKAGLSKQTFDEAMQKLQLALVWCNPGQMQLAGSSRRPPDDDAPRRLVFKTFGASTANLLDAVAYRPSLTSGLRFLEPKMGGTLRCTDAGRDLAEAFDRHARKADQYEWLSDVENLEGTRDQVLSLEKVLDVGNPTADERAAFLKQFFPPLSTPGLDQASVNRTLAIQLLLRAADSVCRVNQERGEGAFASEEQIRECMARGRAEDGSPLDLADVEVVQAHWAILQVRQLQRLALDVLYCAVERVLERLHEQTTEAVAIDAVCKFIGALAQEGLEPEYTTSVDQMRVHIAELQGDAETLYEAATGEGIGSDADVFAQIRDLLDDDLRIADDGSCHAVTTAYIALCVCAAEVSNLNRVERFKSVIASDRDACSLNALAKTFGEWLVASPSEFITYLVRHWVVRRHFLVVADRSSGGDGKNRFRFVVGDRGLERFNPSVSLPFPAMAQDRLQHMLILCAQSGLLREEEGNYSVTLNGKRRMF